MTVTADTSAEAGNRLSTLGSALLKMHETEGRPDSLSSAIAAYRRAIAITGHDTPDRLRYRINLVNALTRVDPASAAVEADAIWAANLAASEIATAHLAHANALLARADLMSSAVDANDAIVHFERACTVGLVLNPSVTLLASIRWGSWLSSRKLWSEATTAFDYGIRASNLLFRRQAARTAKLTWLQHAQSLTRLCAFAHARQGELEISLAILECGRTRFLSAVAEQHRVKLSTLKTTNPALYTRYQLASDRVSALQDSAETVIDAAAIARLEKEFEQANTELDAVIDEIRAISKFSDLFSSPDLPAIQEIVTREHGSSGSAAVYIVVTGIGGVALLITATGTSAIRLDVTESDLRELAGIAVDGNGEGYLFIQDKPQQMMKCIAFLLDRLAPLVVGPIAAALRSAFGGDSLVMDEPAKGDGNERMRPRVVLIPTGLLAALPLHAAPVRTNAAWPSARCLVDEFDVSYAPSIRTLRYCRDRADQLHGVPPRFLGVGDPHPTPDLALPALRRSRAEVEGIAEFFDGAAVTLCNEHATLTAVAEQLRSSTVGHFACHGFFDVSSPFGSGLFLGDGVLTVADIIDATRVSAPRFICLSACQSALPEFARVSEELIGLPAALIEAGVPGVVGSLWPTHDLAAPLLMLKFYDFWSSARTKNTQPMSPGHALSAAQRWLKSASNETLATFLLDLRMKLDDPTLHAAFAAFLDEHLPEFFFHHRSHDVPYREAYFWAPFVFIGA